MEREKSSSVLESTRSIPKVSKGRPASWRELFHHRHIQPTWKPSFFQLRPIAGVLALVIAVCCPIASLAVLLVSDRQSIDSWPIQPAVYLAIIAALTNTALQVARAEALPIHWWYRAFRGSTVKELERQWEVGNSFASAVRHSGKHVSNASIASLTLALFIIDGPLLQRASTIGPGQRSSQVTLEVMLAPEIPTGFSGYWYEQGFISSPHSLDVVRGWMHKDPIMIDVTGCEGVCTGTVQGPGMVKSNCTSNTWPITSEMMHSPNATWGGWKGLDLNNPGLVLYSLPFFEVFVVPLRHPHQPGGAHLRVGRVSVFNLKGEYTETVCVLLPAIVEHDISIEGRQVTLSTQENQRRIVDLANNTAAAPWQSKPERKLPATLDTLIQFFAYTVQANVTGLMNVPPFPGEIWEYGFFSVNGAAVKQFNLSNGINDTNFFDPTPDIVKDFNELMFRGGIATAHWPNLTNLIDPGLSPKQTISAQQHQNLNIFRSNLRWWAGAAAFDLLTILVVLPLFNHWWKFDRNRSLSPFELALAFNSPLVRDVASNAGPEGVIRQIGEEPLKFGAVRLGDSLLDEEAADPVGINQSSRNQGGDLRVRIGIDKAEDVITLQKGMNFAR